MTQNTERSRFVIFGMIGVINTFTHSMIVICAVELITLNPVTANTVAFLITNILSYLMNSKWTFELTPSLLGYGKFLVASAGGLFITVAFATLAEFMEWHYLIGLFLIIVIMPFLTFFVYKVWVFRSGSS